MFKNRNKPNDEPVDVGQPTQHGCGSGSCGCSGGGAQAEPEAQAAGDSLEAKLAQAMLERDEANSKYLMALADFQNYKRRALENEREARRQGITSLVLSIVPVLDHFDLALAHDPSKMTAAQVVDGVKVIRDELLKTLGSNGIGVINPQPNDELDPNRHMAIMQQPAEGIEPGRIAKTLQIGYTLGDRVIRPANVVVAPSGT